MRLRRRKYRPLKRRTEFVLIHNPELPNDEVVWPHDLDGPFRPNDVRVLPDGTTEYVAGDGVPYVAKVTRLEGNLVTMADGSQMRLESWPLQLAS